MPDDEERLVVLLEARIRDLEKNMAKASGITGKTYREMSLGSKRATAQMESDMVRSTTRINQALATVSTRVGTFGKTFGAGLVGGIAGLGIAGIISQFGEVAKSIAEVGDEAKRAGVDVKSFQELKYVAEQNRIGVDALTDGLKELNLRADEFILTGKGSSAEAFQRLGYNADTLKAKLEDPSALFTEIIGKLGQLDKAAQIRVADEIFGGTGGEKFVQLIDQGEKGIRDTIDAANDLGIVMDKEMIERAAELDRQFAAVTTTVGSGLKKAIVEAANALSRFVDLFRAIDQRTTSSLESSLATSKGNLAAAQAGKERAFGFMQGPFDKQIEKSQKEIDALTAELKQRAMAGLRTDLAQQRSQLENPLPDVVTTSSTAGSKSRGSSSAAVDREKEAVKGLIAELEEELRLVGASDAERRKAEASRQAGAAATDQERAKIVSLTEAIYQEEEARQRQADAMDLGRDITRGAIDDLTAGIETSKNLWENLGDAGVNALRRIADTMIDDVLDSIFQVSNAAGGGGGIFGTLFSGIGSLFGSKSAAPSFLDNGFDTGLPKFAKGGIAASPSIFGDAGPEAAVPLPDGRRIPVDLGTSGGGSQNVHVTTDVRVSVDQNGELKAFVERTSHEVSTANVRSYDKQMPDRVQQINRNPRQRG